MGRIIGWFFLGLLFVLLLLLFAPGTLEAEYRGGALRVKLRVLLIPLTLYPARPRRKKAERPKRPRKQGGQEKPEPERPKREKTLEERIDFVRQVADAGGGALGFVLRHMRVRDVEFAAILNTGDAAETAIWYGRLHAALGALVASLSARLDIRFKRLEIVPDFADAYEHSILLAGKIHAAPIVLLAAGVIGIKRFLGYRKTPHTKVRPAAQPQTKEL